MTRDKNFRSAAAIAAALILGLSSLATHSRLKLELTGQSTPEDAEEFTEAYEGCSASLVDVELNGDVMMRSSIALKYRPAPLYTNVDNAGLRAYFTSPSYMVRDDTIYRLVSLEFHLPGDGIAQQGAYPLMANFVHYGQDGSFGVLGVRFEEGDANPELEKLLAAAGGAEDISGMNPRGILPEQLDTPYAMGPGDISSCDYQMYWYFAGQSVTASAEQIAQVRAFLTATDG